MHHKDRTRAIQDGRSEDFARMDLALVREANGHQVLVDHLVVAVQGKDYESLLFSNPLLRELGKDILRRPDPHLLPDMDCWDQDPSLKLIVVRAVNLPNAHLGPRPHFRPPIRVGPLDIVVLAVAVFPGGSLNLLLAVLAGHVLGVPA